MKFTISRRVSTDISRISLVLVLPSIKPWERRLLKRSDRAAKMTRWHGMESHTSFASANVESVFISPMLLVSESSVMGFSLVTTVFLMLRCGQLLIKKLSPENAAKYFYKAYLTDFEDLMEAASNVFYCNCSEVFQSNGWKGRSWNPRMRTKQLGSLSDTCLPEEISNDFEQESKLQRCSHFDLM